MELDPLVQGYRLCARSEGKSQKTIDIVASSVAQLPVYVKGFKSSHPDSYRGANLPPAPTQCGSHPTTAP
jgi:hypothetical protein